MQAADAQSNYLQGKKKPSASVPAARIYLKQAIRHYLYKADSAACEKQGFEKLEIVRDLTRRLRKQAGFSWWVPVCFAVSVCVLFVLWLAGRTGKADFYHFPEHTWRVVQNLSPCLPDGSCGELYMIQEVNNGVANPPTMVQFRGPQHFEQGMTFSWIRVTKIGSRFDVDGWDVVRQDRPPVFINGKWRKLPTLANNCAFDWSTPEGHVLCAGGIAKF